MLESSESQKLKLGIIGTFINDHVIYTDKNVEKCFGGIYYTISILANLLSNNDIIYPVCRLGEDINKNLRESLSKYPNINTKGISNSKEINTKVKLIYKDKENRDEIISNILPPIELSLIQSIGSVNAWLVNFITGFEISLDDFIEFREGNKSIISMDYHSLSLGVNKRGKRIKQFRSDWQLWINKVDILQMNEIEAGIILQKENPSENELLDFGLSIIENGIKIFNLTRGSNGSIVFFRKNNDINNTIIPSVKIKNTIDVTGCGDAFLAGFLIHYLKYNNITKAAIYANKVAAAKTKTKGTSDLHNIKKLINLY